MVDYYEELNLNQQDSVNELNQNLIQLESTWKRREINNPEKATKMLALILEARNAFKSDATKKEYDHNLAESKKAPEQVDYNAERKAQFEQYKDQALRYFANGNQQDLALMAITRAKQNYDPSQPDASFCELCSLIKYDVGDFQDALSEINEAIMIDSYNASYYNLKAEILGHLYDTVSQNPTGQTARSYMAQKKANDEKALELAKQSGDKKMQRDCLEELAFAYSWPYDSDYDRAEIYANQALELTDGAPSERLQVALEQIKEGKEVFQTYQGKNHPSTTSSDGGCYIATAVYGSYDCPEVWVLRRYRDFTLAKTPFGRLFIKSYYTVSPTVVKLFGHTKWFNRFWKNKLDKMVDKLQKRGYSSDRYYD